MVTIETIEEYLNGVIETKKVLEESCRICISSIYVSVEAKYEESYYYNEEDDNTKEPEFQGYCLSISFELSLPEGVKRIKDDILNICAAFYDKKGRVIYSDILKYIYKSDFKGYQTETCEIDKLFNDIENQISRIVIYPKS